MTQGTFSRREFIASLGALPVMATAAIGNAACSPPVSAFPVPTVSASLRHLSGEFSACAAAGRCKPELRGLFGMAYPTGIVVDRDNRDLILVGPQAQSGPYLDIDDMVAALRTTFGFYPQHPETPGVSIDPDPAIWAELARLGNPQAARTAGFGDVWTETCEMPMTTRVLGLPDCRMALAMLEADFLLKNISNGRYKPPVPGFRSLHDETVARLERDEPANTARSSRFWFTAGPFDYAADSAGFLLERAEVHLLTEVQRFSQSGTLVDSAATDSLAEVFACRFTSLYPKISAHPDLAIYKMLADMFRWVAIARIMRDNRAFETVGLDPASLYLMTDWPTRTYDIPQVYPGQARVVVSQAGNQSIELSSCGGVSVDFPSGLGPAASPKQDAGMIARRTIAARPSPEALAWLSE